MELKSRSEKSPQNALAKEMFSSSRVLSSTLLKIESCVENGLPRSVKRSAKQTKRNQRTIRTTKSNCADREQNIAGENGKHPTLWKKFSPELLGARHSDMLAFWYFENFEMLSILTFGNDGKLICFMLAVLHVCYFYMFSYFAFDIFDVLYSYFILDLFAFCHVRYFPILGPLAFFGILACLICSRC